MVRNSNCSFLVDVGEGKHKITLRMCNTKDGWVGYLSGGQLPHVGGVVLAVPKLSETARSNRCNAWVVPVPDHKDVEVALPLAIRICETLNEVVSLTAGIHIDNATNDDIRVLVSNCHLAGDKFLEIVTNK